MGRSSRILGIEIEWRANILALVAFLLSLASIVYNAVGYFEGARIEQYPPKQVILYAHEDPDIRQDETHLPFEHQLLTFISTMRYVNRGRPRYKDTISGIEVTFMLPDGSGPYRADWHADVSFDNFTGELRSERSASAITLPGEDADSVEAWFVPRQQSDWITIAAFREQFEATLTGKEMEWSLRFQSRSDLSGETQSLSAECRVRLGPRTVQSLSSPDVRWVALNCLDS